MRLSYHEFEYSNSQQDSVRMDFLRNALSLRRKDLHLYGTIRNTVYVERAQERQKLTDRLWILDVYRITNTRSSKKTFNIFQAQ